TSLLRGCGYFSDCADAATPQHIRQQQIWVIRLVITASINSIVRVRRTRVRGSGFGVRGSGFLVLGSATEPRTAKPRTQNRQPRTQNREPRTENLEPRTPNPCFILAECAPSASVLRSCCS